MCPGAGLMSTQWSVSFQGLEKEKGALMVTTDCQLDPVWNRPGGEAVLLGMSVRDFVD